MYIRGRIASIFAIHYHSPLFATPLLSQLKLQAIRTPSVCLNWGPDTANLLPFINYTRASSGSRSACIMRRRNSGAGLVYSSLMFLPGAVWRSVMLSASSGSLPDRPAVTSKSASARRFCTWSRAGNSKTDIHKYGIIQWVAREIQQRMMDAYSQGQQGEMVSLWGSWMKNHMSMIASSLQLVFLLQLHYSKLLSKLRKVSSVNTATGNAQGV